MSDKDKTKSTTKAEFDAKTAGLEKWADELVNKKQPLQLPVGARKWIADNSWWIVLVGGILSLLGAWSFWQAGHYVSTVGRWANDIAAVYGSTTYATDLGPMWYVALAGLAVEGVLLLLAVNKLKEHKKSGWNLVFYVSLLNLALAIVYLLIPGYGFGSLLGAVIGTAVNWFFLFQVRSYFTK